MIITYYSSDVCARREKVIKLQKSVSTTKGENVNNEENSSENEETNLSDDNKGDQGNSDQKPAAENRPDPFANLELPPPVGSDDDWSEEDADGHSEMASEDHSALGNAMGGESDSQRREKRSKIPSLSLFGEDGGDGGGGLFGDLGGFDGGLESFNDPTVAQLDDVPFLGGRTSGGDMFGNRASGVQGRATSPKLFAQASQFPTCHQLRCWKWENGIPVGLGVIDAQATEEDFVETFYDAMPRPTQGKGQFKMRPIDINGQEMGQEITLLISEHHVALKRIRDAKEYDEKQHQQDQFGGFGGFGQEDPASTMANQMSAAYDRMFQMTEKKQEALERTLTSERDRMREADLERAQERVDLATNTAQGIQVLTERMMADEAGRSERALQMQNEQSQMLIGTLTSIFSQQQTMMQQYQESQRSADQQRIEQERTRATREREDLDERRRRDQNEYDRRQKREEQEFEQKWRLAEEQRKADRDALQAQIDREKEEMRTRAQSDSARLRTDIEHMRLRMEQERLHAESKMQREREEYQLRMRHEREEAERREKDRKDELVRQEVTRKQEFELRQKQMEIQAQRDREHQERLMQMSMLERETQRETATRRESQERDMRAQAEVERKRQHELMIKELDMSRERDREHNQKMLELSKMEIAARGQDSITGMLPKITGLLKGIGLEPQDVIQRALGIGGSDDGDGEDESSEGGILGKIPDMLGAAGDIAKVVMAARGLGGMMGGPDGGAGIAPPPPPPPRPRPRRRPAPMIDAPSPNFMAQQTQPQPQAVPAQSENVMRMSADQLNNPPPMRKNTPQESINQPKPETSKPKISLPLGDQKTARIAARNMVAELVKSDKSKWQEILTIKLMEQPVVLAYIMETSVYYTVTEAGGSDEFTREFVAELQSSGMVPAEIPMGV